jgi:hypothetical protein
VLRASKSPACRGPFWEAGRHYRTCRRNGYKLEGAAARRSAIQRVCKLFRGTQSSGHSLMMILWFKDLVCRIITWKQ